MTFKVIGHVSCNDKIFQTHTWRRTDGSGMRLCQVSCPHLRRGTCGVERQCVNVYSLLHSWWLLNLHTDTTPLTQRMFKLCSEPNKRIMPQRHLRSLAHHFEDVSCVPVENFDGLDVSDSYLAQTDNMNLLIIVPSAHILPRTIGPDGRCTPSGRHCECLDKTLWEIREPPNPAQNMPADGKWL